MTKSVARQKDFERSLGMATREVTLTHEQKEFVDFQSGSAILHAPVGSGKNQSIAKRAAASIQYLFMSGHMLGDRGRSRSPSRFFSLIGDDWMEVDSSSISQRSKRCSKGYPAVEQQKLLT